MNLEPEMFLTPALNLYPYVKKRILLLGARLLQVADLSDSP